MLPTRRPRVLLLIPHLGGGGAEGVTARLARGLAPQKYELHLGWVTGQAEGADEFPAEVALHALGARRVRAGAWKLLRLIRRIEPDVVLSGMAHLNFLILMLRPLFPRRTRVIVRQNSTASTDLQSRAVPGFTSFLYRLLYRRADRVICQSEAMADDLVRVAGADRRRLRVLANPVDVDAIRKRVSAILRCAGTGTEPGGPQLLAVGRLSREKGFDLLIEALARVRQRFRDVRLTILGGGPEETALQSQCSALGLDGNVALGGQVNDVADYLARAEVFVLSSRREGMPNALLEAAAAGLPIVALPASQGVVNLLCGRPGVWLADEISSEALAECLEAALEAIDPGARFAHEFLEPFALENAIAGYEAVIDGVLSEAGA